MKETKKKLRIKTKTNPKKRTRHVKTKWKLVFQGT